MVLTKNFEFLNESEDFEFKDNIVSLLQIVEDSLKEDTIPNSILHDCRIIYEYIVLQLGLAKKIKIDQIEEKDRI
jgi:uncharacterized Fe-S cluster-containing protein